KKVDLLASHGQTILHIPSIKDSPAFTLQIADGDILAQSTGLLTVSDFRMKHIAAGGDGAPLAPYGDLLLFGDNTFPTLLINLGGISNFSRVPARNKKGKMIFSDLGPGNCLMDQWAKKAFDLNFDRDGVIAKGGQVDEHLLKNWLDDPFFSQPFPKTTGPEYFRLARLGLNDVDPLSRYNVMATLNALTAHVVGELINDFKGTHPDGIVNISGGGASNPTLMSNIRFRCPGVGITTKLPHQISADAKEAVVFAMLANETLSESSVDFSEFGLKDIKMGKISIPY